MAPHDQLQNAAWRKSSYSNGATQCVEAASIGGMCDLARRVKTGQLGA